jgi:glutamate synthase (NADPH) small chain
VIEQAGHGTVTIGAVEKHITDTAWEEGWVKPVKPPRERERVVGIIGAGPGGLAAAEELRRRGYQVTVYDRYDRVGGLMIYGIPNFKLEKEIVARRADLLARGRRRIPLNCEVGRDVEFRRAARAARCGADRHRRLQGARPQGAGRRPGGIVPALDYLTASNRKGLGDAVPDSTSAPARTPNGKRVVVIGGGDTAMDCVRTAVRQGAKSVTCLYRRDRANMPGSHARGRPRRGGGRRTSSGSLAPEAFLGDDARRRRCARSACISACPMPPAASRADRGRSPARISRGPAKPTGDQGARLRSRGPAA